MSLHGCRCVHLPGRWQMGQLATLDVVYLEEKPPKVLGSGFASSFCARLLGSSDHPVFSAVPGAALPVAQAPPAVAFPPGGGWHSRDTLAVSVSSGLRSVWRPHLCFTWSFASRFSKALRGCLERAKFETRHGLARKSCFPGSPGCPEVANNFRCFPSGFLTSVTPKMEMLGLGSS